LDKVIAVVVAALALAIIGAGKALAWLLARGWRAAATVAARRRERRKRQPAQGDAVRAQPEPPCATPWSPPAVAQAADAIYTVDLGAWVVNIRYYRTQQRAERVLRPVTQDEADAMRRALKMTRIELPEAAVQAGGIEEVLLDTEVTAAQVIAKIRADIKRIEQGGIAVSPSAAHSESPPQQAQAPAGDAIASGPSAEEVAAVEAAPRQPGPASPFQPSSRLGRIGVAQVGTVAEARVVDAMYADGAGTTFEVLLVVGDEEVAMRGVQLQKEFELQRIGRGDKVAITPLGRQPVVDGSGKKRKRNEYRVEVLERANPAQARP